MAQNGRVKTRSAAPRASRTLRETIVESIRSAITDGIYPPGTPLAEVELAQRFKVSRGPIREALIQLQSEFLVRSYPNRGTFVHSLTEQEFDEIERLRGLLEPLAMEYAKANATPELLKELERMLWEMVELARAGEYRLLADRDFAFHCAIWDLSGTQFLSQVLRQVTRPLFAFFKISWKKYRNSQLNLEVILGHHEPILEFLKGTSNLSAAACFRAVMDSTDREEKPLLLRDPGK